MKVERIFTLVLLFLISTNLFCRTDSLFDKSNIYFQNPDIYITNPNSKENIISLIELAQTNKQKIIIQGKRHSANGSSIGDKSEIILNTKFLNNIQILEDKVVVGSGVILEELDEYLKKNGYQLLAKNDGGKGPTVGGFISAGGIGKGGGDIGFWETVLKINLIDGKGNLVTLTPENEDFKWLFGSMGQLGVIYEAEIKISKIIDYTEQNEFDSSSIALFKNNYFYWFPFFSKKNKKDSLISQLIKFNNNLKSMSELKNVISFINEGGIDIKFRSFNPPLLINFNEDITVYGLKIFINKSDTEFISKLNIIRSEVDCFINLNNIKSYFQVSYYDQNKKNIQKYLGSTEYDFLKKLKIKYDPDNVFGKNIF